MKEKNLLNFCFGLNKWPSSEQTILQRLGNPYYIINFFYKEIVSKLQLYWKVIPRKSIDYIRYNIVHELNILFNLQEFSKRESFFIPQIIFCLHQGQQYNMIALTMYIGRPYSFYSLLNYYADQLWIFTTIPFRCTLAL